MSITSDKEVLTALLPALNVLLAAHGNCVPCREHWLADANMALTRASVRVHYEWQTRDANGARLEKPDMVLVPFDMPASVPFDMPVEIMAAPAAVEAEQVPVKRSHHKKV